MCKIIKSNDYLTKIDLAVLATRLQISAIELEIGLKNIALNYLMKYASEISEIRISKEINSSPVVTDDDFVSVAKIMLNVS